MMEKNSCPYCKKRLTKIPQRKTNCEFCKENIFVRTIPSSMERILIKESEIKKVEELWIDYLSNSYWFKELEKIGASKKSINEMYYSLKERFGTTPLIADVMWGLFNKFVSNIIKEGNKNKYDFVRNLMDEFKERESRGEELWNF
jgi:hypothetical protein